MGETEWAKNVYFPTPSAQFWLEQYNALNPSQEETESAIKEVSSLIDDRVYKYGFKPLVLYVRSETFIRLRRELDGNDYLSSKQTNGKTLVYGVEIRPLF